MVERAASTIGAAARGADALLHGKTSSPRLDAEILLAFLLKQPREFLLAHRTDPLPLKLAVRYTHFVRRRMEGVPIPYLTGVQAFYGRPFAVTPAVMIPRPESEAMVDETLHLLDVSPPPASQFRHPIVADLGTGSGVLAVTIALEAPRATVVATDRSANALVVARRNTRRYRVARRVTFVESDLLTEIPRELAPHIIVANLPYISSDELKRAGDPTPPFGLRHSTPSSWSRGGAGHLDTRGLTFEPQRALDGGPDGLYVIRRFWAQLARHRTHNSQLLTRLVHIVLEHSPDQRRRILELAHDTLPPFRPHEATPFVTSWTKTR